MNPIKNRKSYKRYSELAQKLISFGVKKTNIKDALISAHLLVEQLRGYGSNSAAVYAHESICLIVEEIDETFRICSECEKEMSDGYCINGGEEHYCSDKCLTKHYTKREFMKMFNNGQSDTYWTKWD